MIRRRQGSPFYLCLSLLFFSNAPLSNAYHRIAPVKMSAGVMTEPFTTEKSHVKLNVLEIDRRGAEATPVVLLHGLLGSSRNFRSWATALHERLQLPRKIIVPDLRNHGTSTHARGMSYNEMAADVCNLLDERGIEQAILVGHSMGGKVAAGAALMNPKRVAGLVVMDIAPVTYTTSDGTHWGETYKVIETLKSIPLHEIPDKSLLDSLLAERGIDDPAIRAFAICNAIQDPKTKRLVWQINLDAIHSALPTIASFELNDAPWKQYSQKTLFLNGGKSKYLRSAHLGAISKLFPTFTIATIRNAGHWVHAEAPEETLAIVQKYLDDEIR